MKNGNLIDNQGFVSGGNAFLSRYKERYPELPDGDKNAIYGRKSDDFDKFDKSETAKGE